MTSTYFTLHIKCFHWRCQESAPGFRKKAVRGSRTVRRGKLESALACLGSNLLVHLISFGEESFNNLQRLLVNLLVLMRLKIFNFVQAAPLLHHRGHLVSLAKLVRRCEDVGKSIHHHADSLVVL